MSSTLSTVEALTSSGSPTRLKPASARYRDRFRLASEGTDDPVWNSRFQARTADSPGKISPAGTSKKYVRGATALTFRSHPVRATVAVADGCCRPADRIR